MAAAGHMGEDKAGHWGRLTILGEEQDMVLGQVGPLGPLLKCTQGRVTWWEGAGCGAHRAPGHVVREQAGHAGHRVCVLGTHPSPSLSPLSPHLGLSAGTPPWTAAQLRRVAIQGEKGREGLCIPLGSPHVDGPECAKHGLPCGRTVQLHRQPPLLLQVQDGEALVVCLSDNHVHCPTGTSGWAELSQPRQVLTPSPAPYPLMPLPHLGAGSGRGHLCLGSAAAPASRSHPWGAGAGGAQWA